MVVAREDIVDQMARRRTGRAGDRHEAIKAARRRQATDAFAAADAARAGVEGTLTQGARARARRARPPPIPGRGGRHQPLRNWAARRSASTRASLGVFCPV